MEEKLNNLEKTIKFYIKNHAGSKVVIEVSKEIDFTKEPHLQKSMTWQIKVEHPPIELL